MKNLIVVFISLFFLFASCGKDKSVSPTDPVKELPALTELTNQIDKLLENNDAKGFEKVILPRVLVYYQDAINENSTKLKDFAPIFKTRRLIASDSTHAVFDLEYDGKSYEITFTVDEEGKWFLKNF